MSLAPPDVDGETRAGGQAETAYREALTANPNDAAALYGLGLKFKEDGRLEDALALFTRAGQSAGSPIDAMIEAGVVSALLGRQQDALRWIGDACRKHRDRYEPHYLLGRMLASQNRYAEAAASFQRALAAPPPDVTDAAKGLIFCLRKLSRFEEAREATQIWARVRRDDPACPATLAHIFLEWGKPSEALPHARRAAAMDPQSADNAILVARILVLLDRPNEAETELARAREQQPRNTQLLAHLGNTLKIAGKFAEAREALSQALASDPGNATILFELAEIKRFSAGDPLIAEMEQLAASSKRRADVSKLHYALGKAYDDADDPDRAFPHFAKANAAQRADSPYDEARTLSVFEILRSIFTASFLDERRGSGSPSERPIFIVGMPRSGSTLIEQILASHPDVAAAGEVSILARAVETALPTPGFSRQSSRPVAFKHRGDLANLSRTHHVASRRSCPRDGQAFVQRPACRPDTSCLPECAHHPQHARPDRHLPFLLYEIVRKPPPVRERPHKLGPLLQNAFRPDGALAPRPSGEYDSRRPLRKYCWRRRTTGAASGGALWA